MTTVDSSRTSRRPSKSRPRHNRGAIMGIPIGKDKSAPIEVHCMATDAYPYMFFYTLIRIVLRSRADRCSSELKVYSR